MLSGLLQIQTVSAWLSINSICGLKFTILRLEVNFSNFSLHYVAHRATLTNLILLGDGECVLDYLDFST